MALIPVTLFGAQLTTAEVAFVQNLAGLSYAQGDILYYNGGNLTRLPIGTATQVLKVNAGATAPEWGSVAGAGTVTSVSVVSANGFAGTVATATSTPAITLTTTITGVLKGNGTAISAATDGTDFLSSTTGLKLDQTSAQTIANDSPIFGSLTASELVATTAAKKLQSLAVATYPSLTELTYLKGVTSAIQTQINAKGVGTVTSVGFTGGIISVATATSTPAFTIAGTSGGIPYFSSATTWATSAALAANAIVIGGGAGVAPSTTTTGTGVLTALGVAVGSAGAFITFNGDAGTPSALVGTNISGTATSLTAGNATAAATVASANEGTDTTCFPLFITASGTQTLATKNNTSLTFNSNTGALGATSFVGAGTSLTGIPYSLTGTANQVTLSAATGNITFSLPNDLRITSASVGTNADSIPTLSSTSTLTNKTLTSPTLTTPSAFTTGGTITLAENTSIALDPAGSADGKYTGITVTGTGGATIAFGDVVYLAVADSRWELTDASAVGTAGTVQIGIAVSTSTDGNPLTVLLQGIIRADAAFPTFTVGAAVYLSETAGDVTQTAPTTADAVVRVCGFALTADEMYWNPSPDHATVTG